VPATFPPPDSVSVRLAGPEDMEEVFDLRSDVFCIEQGVPLDLERDLLDDDAVHVVARFRDDLVVGTGRLLAPGQDGPRAVIGRLAVDDRARRLGVGAALLDLLEAQARERGWEEVELHAQVQALGFYTRAGYVPYGEVYEEAGLDHQGMRKRL
jgi:predicted GNAT family N-acyltransferase